MNRRNFITVVGSGIVGGIISAPVHSCNANSSVITNPAPSGIGSLKTIVLIGDSIRMAYQPFIISELKDKAIVVGPEENCQHSGVILQNLYRWVIDQKPAMVHMNAGLHEIYRNEKGIRQVSIEKYTSNLETIFRTLIAAGIKIIWSTTTPVIDDWYFKEKGYKCRVDEDVVAFNNAASVVLNKFKIPVLDLYTFCKNQPKELFYSKDGVHFSSEGSSQQGKLISAFILKNL